MKNQTSSKSNLLLLTLLSLILTICFISSCKKEDSETWPNTLIGTWDINELTSWIDGEEKVYSKNLIDSIGMVWTYHFFEDSTLSYIRSQGHMPDTISGNWSVSNDTITTKIVVSGVWRLAVFKYSIEENMLKLKWAFLPDSKDHGEWIRRN